MTNSQRREGEPRSASPAQRLVLGIDGFTYEDLYAPAALSRLHRVFVDDLEYRDPGLGLRYRELLDRGAPTRDEETEAIMALGPHLGRFLCTLFGLKEVTEPVIAETRALDLIFRVRKGFVRRHAAKVKDWASLIEDDVASTIGTAYDLIAKLGEARRGEHPELAYCRTVEALQLLEKDPTKGTSAQQAWLADNESSAVAPALESLQTFAALCIHGRIDPTPGTTWLVFRLQHGMDFEHLVPLEYPEADREERFTGPESTWRFRDGFGLTDPRMPIREALAEIDTCIFCHNQGKDSCAKGLHDKRSGEVKKNLVGIELAGCPLDEHISEAHLLRHEGELLGSLAAIMVNNPMCPGTGHRICNDCMKACIYQKQDPVDIPQAETSILTQALRLPFGIEIFGLLTRWNPLNLKRPYQLPLNGKRVMVVGLGPAGYTLAHYLTQEGFGVVAVDGLKLEPLEDGLVDGAPRPVSNWDEFTKPLDQRRLDGFGGVSEYGITVRWDKNFLRLLYMTLGRKHGLKMYGGVRFGGTIDLEDAKELGFDHVAIATGAGKPTVVSMKNNLIRGVRKASDFLMALQLTGACKMDSLANLQLSLPAVVIGGGLTAIDTATELMAYYPVMVEKVLKRSEMLAADGLLEAFLERLNPEERATYDEFVEHAEAIRQEREAAASAGREPNVIALLQGWGGVTMAYRKRLQDSPAYRLNHEEVIKAFEEGIFFIEGISPTEAVPDEGEHIQALKLERKDGTTLELPCRSLLVAAGTSPNVIYEKENPGTFVMDGKFFKPHAMEHVDGGFKLHPVPTWEGDEASEAFFTSYDQGISVSYYGDNHPAYAGNVVKAMASARRGYPKVVELFRSAITNLDPDLQDLRDRNFYELGEKLDQELIARVVRVERLTPTITEVVLHAPFPARKFEPGQFYRLQDFEAEAPLVRGVRMSMEGIALTGAWVDKEQGLLSLIVLEMGGSSSLCALLRKGQKVVCMGPTGTPTEIPKNEKVVLLGGGLGNAVLFSIAKALKSNGCSVLYFAGYKDGSDLFKREEIEAATDQVIFSTDMGEEITADRSQDSHFRGNIVQAMIAYADGRLGDQTFPMNEAQRIVVIGSDRMMAAVAKARHDPELLAPYLSEHAAIASINSPMQCMMKEVCAQCLQRHIDPETGEETFVFSCFNQDQDMDRVDFHHLNLRLRQNGVLEKLSAATISSLLASSDLPRV